MKKSKIMRIQAEYMKKIILTVLIAVFVLFAEPRIHGFFIQPSLSYGGIDYMNTYFATQEHFDMWVQSMADVGAKYLIYQWSARYEFDQTWYSNAHPLTPSDAEFAFYDIAQDTINGIPTQSWTKPTSWPGADVSPVDRVIVACEKAGIKLWIGLYLNEGDNTDPSKNFNWWNAVSNATISAQDSANIEHHVKRSLSMIDDIANQFGTNPAFAGFYYTIEVANVAFIPPANHAYLASILDRVADRAHEKVPGSLISISPFYNTKLASATEYGTMWEYALSNSDFDLVILQDGAGVDPFTLTDTTDAITPYYEALKTAADNAGKTLWANSEIFTQDDGGTRLNPKFIPGSIEGIKRQLVTENAVVDTFVCFGFHYMDPKPLHKFTAGHLGGLSNEAILRKNLYDDYKNYHDSLVAVSTDDFAVYKNKNQIYIKNASLYLNGISTTIKVISFQGRVIKKISGVKQKVLPLSNFTEDIASGFYLIVIKNKISTKTLSVIVTH